MELKDFTEQEQKNGLNAFLSLSEGMRRLRQSSV